MMVLISRTTARLLCLAGGRRALANVAVDRALVAQDDVSGADVRLPKGLLHQAANGAVRTIAWLSSTTQWSHWSDGRRVHDFQHVTDRTRPARGADVHTRLSTLIRLSRLRSDRGAYRQPGCLYPIAATVKRDQLFPVHLLPAQVTRAMLNRFSLLSRHVSRWFVSSPPNAHHTDLHVQLDLPEP
jgi:hypothetical protein